MQTWIKIYLDETSQTLFHYEPESFVREICSEFWREKKMKNKCQRELKRNFHLESQGKVLRQRQKFVGLLFHLLRTNVDFCRVKIIRNFQTTDALT